MQVMVRMLANNEPAEGDPIWRVVDVPQDCRNGGSDEARLEQVFYFGQNDFQPQQCCSVSVGDVIFLPDENENLSLWVCASMGFRRITQEQFQQLEAMNRRDRSFSEIVRPRN